MTALPPFSTSTLLDSLPAEPRYRRAASSEQAAKAPPSEGRENPAYADKKPSFSERYTEARGQGAEPPKRDVEAPREQRSVAREEPPRARVADDEPRDAERQDVRPADTAERKQASAGKQPEPVEEQQGLSSGSELLVQSGADLPLTGEVLPPVKAETKPESLVPELTSEQQDAVPGEVESIAGEALPEAAPLLSTPVVEASSPALQGLATARVAADGVPSATQDTPAKPNSALPAQAGLLATALGQEQAKDSADTGKGGGQGERAALAKEGLLNALSQNPQGSEQLDNGRFLRQVQRELGLRADADSAPVQENKGLSEILGRFQHTPMSFRSSPSGIVASTTVPTQLANPNWGSALAERMVWFSANQVNHAQLDLDPPDLGPLQVRISSSGEHTHLSFTSPHAAVRDAVDANLPRLKEMFENAGLSLGDVNVSDQSREQARESFVARSQASHELEDAPADGDDTLIQSPVTGSLHMVDYYA